LPLLYSPFTTVVEPGVDASRVRVSGPGVQDNIPASLPVTFLIDTREAGIADLEVLIKVRLTGQRSDH
jgi:filamin